MLEEKGKTGRREIDINIPDKYDKTAIHLAAFNGYTEIVKKLIDDPSIKINLKDDSHKTPLDWAAIKGHTAIVEQLLLKKDINLNSKDHNDRTALHWAAFNGHTAIAEQLLLKESTDINAKDSTQKTPLHLAVLNKHLAIVEQLLLKKSTDINAKDNYDNTPLHLAAKKDLSIFEKLLENGGDLYLTDNHGKSPLHLAAEHDRTLIIDKIIDFIKKSIPLGFKPEEAQSFTMLYLDLKDNNGRTPLHLATKNGNISFVKKLLKENVKVDSADSDGTTPLHYAATNNNLEILNELINHGANINLRNNDNRTALSIAFNKNYWEIVMALMEHNAEFKDLSNNQYVLLEEQLEASHYEKKYELLEKIKIQLLHNFKKMVTIFHEKLKSVGLEVIKENNPRPGCSHGPRRRRDLASCIEVDEDEQDRRLFPYEPLEESVPADQRQAARLYTQAAVMLAWRQQKPLDTLLLYQRHLGDILDEELVNQSPREQRLLNNHYQKAQHFVQNNPQNTLLEVVPDYFKPLNGQSVLIKSLQHALLLFNQGGHYQLYSPDFNYRTLFQTREGVSWPQMSAFIQAFFQWKTGSPQYYHWVLKEELPVKVVNTLIEAPFWKPDDLAPDSMLLFRERHKAIEGIPVYAVRELVRTNGRVVDFAALHADFFQHTTGLQLRVEKLHSVLAELTQAQQRALVHVVNKYHWPADNTLLKSLPTDEQPLLANYQQRVMNELKTVEIISQKRLSELSFQTLDQAFKQFDIPEELTQQAVTNLKKFHARAVQRAWSKGVVTQSLLFLPDMIRAANTGQVERLAATAGLLSADMTLNYSYEKLLEHLSTIFDETRVTLLKKLPITSPVFKALTLYSIVELTQQLQQLPHDSERINKIKHQLGEQYFAVGLMVAEFLGFELGPLWVGLVAEQLIFEAISYRKEYQLDIPFWEAFIMSLGFEQDKLKHIFEERQLVELNLVNLNNINNHTRIPYGWVLVRVPLLGTGQWQAIDEQQVPPEIRQQVANQKEPFSLFTQSAVEWQGFGFKQISYYAVKVEARSLIKTAWHREYYPSQPAAITVEKANSDPDCQEDNIFLANPGGEIATYQRIASVTGSDYALCSQKTPVKISGPGLAALYSNARYNSDENAQRNLYLGFDPREGDMTLLIQTPELTWLNYYNWKSNPNYPLPFNNSFHLTAQIGHKGYPSSILFNQSQLGVLTVSDRSRLLHTHYFINSDTAPFYLYDDAITTRISIAPPRDRRIGFIIQSSSDPTIFQLKTCSSNSSQPFSPLTFINRTLENLKEGLHALLPQQVSLIHLPNYKSYIQLMLTGQEIVGTLTLAAEQIDIQDAKGRDAYQSAILIDERVEKFTVTLIGNLKIIQGNTQLIVFGEKQADEWIIGYSKLSNNPVALRYQLELGLLRPVLDSLNRSNSQKVLFSTAELSCMWIYDAKQSPPAALEIIGTIDGQRAQLLLEKHSSSLSYLVDKQVPKLLAVDHYTPQAELDGQWVLQQFITQEKLANSEEDQQSSFSAVIDKLYSNGTGTILWFQSAQGDPVFHRFPLQSKLTLNGIDYQIIGGQFCAVGAPNGVIDGDQLIRYHTPAQTVAICVESTLSDSSLSLGEESITINQLTLRHLPKRGSIYFGEEGFTLQTLKKIFPRSRQQRDLPQFEPLASGTARNKPWSTVLLKAVVNLIGRVNWYGINQLPAWRSIVSPHQKLSTVDSGPGQTPNTPQNSTRLDGYTSGHLQGLLQLLDVVIRRWLGRPYQPSVTSTTDALAEADARVRAIEIVEEFCIKQPAKMTQQLDRVELQGEVFQRLYANQQQEIADLLAATAQKVFKITDETVPPQLYKRSMAYSNQHQVSSRHLRQQWVGLPTTPTTGIRTNRSDSFDTLPLITTTHHYQ